MTIQTNKLAETADHRAYAMRQLQIAIEKDADAPAAAAQHERQALMALKLERIPTAHESLDSWKSDAETADLLTALKAQTERACRFNCDAESGCDCPAHITYRAALRRREAPPLTNCGTDDTTDQAQVSTGQALNRDRLSDKSADTLRREAPPEPEQC